MRLLVATSNDGKLKEFTRLLSASRFEVVGLSESQQRDPVEETGSSYAENALLKARWHHERTQMVTVADDSGLEVDALHGGPGLHSARYAATDQQRIDKLLRAIEGVPDADRGARFMCAAAVVWEHGERVFHGKVEGRILTKPRGTAGFGFDPLFYYEPLKKTFAELSSDQKDQLSHRGNAFRQIARWLDEADEADEAPIA